MTENAFGAFRYLSSNGESGEHKPSDVRNVSNGRKKMNMKHLQITARHGMDREEKCAAERDGSGNGRRQAGEF